MHFVKWLRKNNQKIMVWVVVVIMITFVGGFSFRQLLSGRGPSKEAVATVNGHKISGLDRVEAISELEILRDMGASQILGSLRSITGPLLSQLIFPDSGSASLLDAQIKYAAMQGNFAVDDEIIQSFFNANKGDAGMYWILLNKEAMDYGCAVDTEKAMEVYKNFTIGLTRGQGQASTMVANLSKQYKVPQEKIIEIFAKLLSVTSYIDTVTRVENQTLPEIAAQIGYAAQKLSATTVDFSAESFTKDIAVSDNELNEQFEAFKTYLPGDITEANPYGFGYKIPARVQLEYIILQLDDVEKLVAKPTEEEMENYYTRNKSQFTEQTEADPANPQAQPSSRVKPYSEVMSEIQSALIEQRTNARAEMIVNDIKAITDQNLLDKDTEKMTGEEIKQFAGDYAAAAKNAADKAGIAVYSGKTGYLSRQELRADRNLGRLSEQKPMRMPVELTTKAFAVQGLDAAALSKFDGTAPKIYENIGPMQGVYPKTIAIVRVIDFKPEEVPADINASFDITKSAISDKPEQQTFAVKDAVTADCKLVKAMAIAKDKAQKFIASAGNDWELAKEEYNKTSENKLWVNAMTDRNLVSEAQIAEAKVQADASGMGLSRLQYTIRNKMMLDGLYAMRQSQLPAVLEFPAGRSVMAVKEVTITDPTTDDYNKAKKETAARIESMAAIKAAFILLNADNLIARTGFEYVETDNAVETEE